MNATVGASLAILLIPFSPVGAGDWPRFRGPNGSGVSDSVRLPVEFGPKTNLSWKANVASGHSSPVVCGNRLYLTSFNDSTLRTQAFDMQTGDALWVRELPRQRKAKHHGLNNAASPSPVCDSKGVVVFFADFGLATWTFDGKPGWRLSIAALANNHGMGSSPVLADDRVLQVLGSDTGSEVLVLHRDSGRELWRDKLVGVTYSTPTVTPDGQAILLSTGEAVSFDLDSGRRRWWVTGVPYQPKASPVLSADAKVVYLSALSVNEDSKNALSSYEKLLQQFDVNGDGQITEAEMRERKGPAGAFPQIDMNGDGVFTHEEQKAVMRIAERPHLAAAFRTDGVGDQTGKPVWSLHKGIPNVASPLLVGRWLYLVKEGGILTVVETSDGSVSSEGRISVSAGAIFASPVAAAGRIYIVNQEGTVIVLRATPDREVLAVNDLGEECFATPAIAGDRIFVRTRNTLWCFREAT